MAEMAKVCPYDQEYLGLLARQGKLQSKKIGKKWFTTVEAVNNYLREKKPGETVKDLESKSLLSKKSKLNYSLLVLVISFLFLLFSFVVYQNIENKISQLETKTVQMEYSPKNADYPFNLPGYADFFAPGKLEF